MGQRYENSNGNGHPVEEEYEEYDYSDCSTLTTIEEDKPLEDDFEFTDRFHSRHDFIVFSQSMRNFGVNLPSQEEEQEEILARHREEKMKESFNKGQVETYWAILDEIENIEVDFAARGLSEWKFTFGIMNCFVIAYVFGAHPGKFWIVYALESAYWMAMKFQRMWNAKPLCEVFYYFDFCWMMNLLGMLVFAGLFFLGNLLEPETRREVFMACYGVAAGPVFLASMVLPFVAVLFHDVNTTANLIIHLLPSMLIYMMRWHPEELLEDNPGMFVLDYLKEESMIPFYDPDLNKGSVVRNATMLYFAWFVPYVIWMLAFGLSLPKKSSNPKAPPPKYDTVFHSLWRGGPNHLVGTMVWKRPKEVSKAQTEMDDYEIRDFLLYMLIHCAGSLGLGVHIVARLCYRSKEWHAALIFLSVIICSKRGASRYTYYATKMYGQQIRKQFAKKLREASGKKKVT